MANKKPSKKIKTTEISINKKDNGTVVISSKVTIKNQ